MEWLKAETDLFHKSYSSQAEAPVAHEERDYCRRNVRLSGKRALLVQRKPRRLAREVKEDEGHLEQRARQGSGHGRWASQCMAMPCTS